MTAITASTVKALREKTGAGMMDCKKALTETGGNPEEAEVWLRKKGLSAAAKKSARAAADGLVAIVHEGKRGLALEVNAETDFVARNEEFQAFVTDLAALGLKVNAADIEALKSTDFHGKTVEEATTDVVARIGENIQLRRLASLTVNDGVVASYLHNDLAPGLGKIGVLVALESSGDSEALLALGRQIAMHVAATSPKSLSVERLDPAAIEKERAIFADQARASGKPDNIIEKMVEGRLRKFYQEVVLLAQSFVINPDLTVQQAIDAAAKELGTEIVLKDFVRYQLGEGIEVEKGNFADEVKSQLAG